MALCHSSSVKGPKSHTGGLSWSWRGGALDGSESALLALVTGTRRHCKEKQGKALPLADSTILIQALIWPMPGPKRRRRGHEQRVSGCLRVPLRRVAPGPGPVFGSSRGARGRRWVETVGWWFSAGLLQCRSKKQKNE